MSAGAHVIMCDSPEGAQHPLLRFVFRDPQPSAAPETSPPVRHLLPLGEHLPGPRLNGQVQPMAEVVHYALVLQQ